MTNCALCGEPMPVGDEVFKYHSGPCPKPPLEKPREETLDDLRFEIDGLKSSLEAAEQQVAKLAGMQRTAGAVEICPHDPCWHGVKNAHNCRAPNCPIRTGSGSV